MKVAPELQAGVDIVRRALEEPIRMIAENAGWDGSIVVNKVSSEKGDYGFNAQTEEYGDLVSQGIIDPTKVVRFALQNSASISGLLLTTDVLITTKPEKKENAPAMPSGGGEEDYEY